MAQLFLIRHANLVREPGVSSHEWRLSENGRSRTRHLAHAHTNHPTRLITSTEAKAVETGQILADTWAIPALDPMAFWKNLAMPDLFKLNS